MYTPFGILPKQDPFIIEKERAMPKQKRYALKQTITTAVGEVEKAQDKVAYLVSVFDGPHPDMAEELKAYFTGLELIREGLTGFGERI